ncbi:hypothetical protein LIER_11459 [Lithospermum erythrorhizon]|uniref:RNase H type-1 domain-containing protein n=1 Tax=Lithospermum erythrorhizon TaxID=34254 RepID=A0AAV3PT94_LITER
MRWWTSLLNAPELINRIEASQEKVLLLYVDAASNPGGTGVGILLWSLEGDKIEYAMRFAFKATNNEADYEALSTGLTLQNALGAEHIHIKMDSQLLVGHVNGDFKIDETSERERNQEADGLSQLVTVGYKTFPKAMVVEWVEEEAFRTKEVMNNNALESEEKRAASVDKMATYKKKVAAYYNKNVRARQFLTGDLVLREIQASAMGKPGKLESHWEGPYIIRKIMGPVTYKLETLKGRQVPRSSNACDLRKYYV